MQNLEPHKKIPALLMSHKNKYYLKFPQEGYQKCWEADKYKIDKTIVTDEIIYRKDRKEWVVLENKPTQIFKRIAEPQKILSYMLKEKLHALMGPNAGLPLTIDVDTYSMSSENIGGEDNPYCNIELSEYYSPTYEEQKYHWEEIPVELILIATNKKPVYPEFSLTYNLPGNILEHPDILPYCPCELSSKQLFPYVRDTIKSKLIDPIHLKIDYDYGEFIQISRRFRFAEEQTFKYKPTLRSRKTLTRKKSEKWVTIIEVRGCPTFSGVDYFDIKKQVDKYINDILVYLIDEPIQECTCCKGNGYVLNKE